MKLIFIGPQGVGKGTYGAMVSEKFNIPLLSAGQLLRDGMKEGTEVGKIAAQHVDKGELVPPEIITDLIKERILKDDCKEGYILDGFPRNLKQLELFGDNVNEIDHVVEFYASEDMLMRRLTGRRTCKDCGAIYNIFPDCDPNPKEEGKCDKCGGEIYQRADDTEEAIKKRLSIYYEETTPILDSLKDKVIRVESKDKPEAIVAKLLELL